MSSRYNHLTALPFAGDKRPKIPLPFTEIDSTVRRSPGMPDYRFVTSDGSVDTQQMTLSDHMAARREATNLLGQILANEPDELWQTCEIKIVVQDARGLTLFEVDAHAVRAPAAPPDR